MNTSNQMDKLKFMFLLIFSCLTFFSVHGRSQDEFSSCDIRLLVKRGMTWAAAPNHSVTVKCPVQHCGESLNVTWCRILDTDECEPINQRESVEISQKSEPNGDKLTSYLKFRQISVQDDGLYRCELKHNQHEHSHMINISVSASYQGVQIYSDNVGAAARVADVVEDVEDESWLLYFYICVGIAILAAALMLFGIFRFYGRKGVMIVNQKMRQEIYTNTLPGLPASAPSTSVLPTHFPIMHENFSHTAVRSVPQLHPVSCRSQPTTAVGHTADRSLSSDHAVYAAINRQQAEEPARELQGRTTSRNTEYASIKFVNSS